MAEFESEKKKPPLWRTSEGRLRESAPRPKRDGQDHLTGYEPSEQEGARRPREAARLSGSYGDVAVGTNRKKELTMVVSRHRSREGPAARREEQVLRSGSAQKLNLSRGEFRVNAHDKKQGALEYRESHDKASRFLLDRFGEMMRTHRPAETEEQLPFLDRRGDREELRRLESRAVDLRAGGGPGARAELRAIERRKQELHQSLSEKETQERRLRLTLERAQEESRRRAGETETVPWNPPPVTEEPLPPGDGKPGAGQDGAPEKPEAKSPDGQTAPEEPADAETGGTDAPPAEKDEKNE